MNDNTTEFSASTSRVLRSARVLTAYFEHKYRLKLQLLSEAPNTPMKEGLQFDLEVSSWGIWGLRADTELSEQIQKEISTSFHSLLGAMDDLEKRKHDLHRLQEKYEAATADLPSNVIPLRRLRAARPVAVHSDKRWTVRQDCLIESAQIMDIHKMALELHSHSQRYIFLDYRDIQKDTRMNLSELLQLGQATIFVSNILDLKMEEQQVLHQLVATPANDRPLLMVGANMAYSELRTDAAIHLEFLLLLSRAYIKLTKSFSEYRDQGLIHYFLDSLAQNPS